MITVLIFVALIVLGIVGLIISHFRCYDDDHDFGCILLISFNLLFLGITSIMILCNNTPRVHELARVEYRNNVEELNASRGYVLAIQDDYSRSVAVVEYNSKVRDFKYDIIHTQINLKNPWINWFHNYAYLEFDANVVSYIS